jgi:PTH1 family peptidyl-tRNA hydrolase
MNWHKVDISNLFVVFDDITLDFGRIRFRPDGSAGSHNGVKSIIQSCGSEKFPRLKVGIGPNPGEALWADYVLQKFPPQEKKHLPELTDLCVEAIECYVSEGIDAAQNKYNGMNILS